MHSRESMMLARRLSVYMYPFLDRDCFGAIPWALDGAARGAPVERMEGFPQERVSHGAFFPEYLPASFVRFRQIPRGYS